MKTGRDIRKKEKKEEDKQGEKGRKVRQFGKGRKHGSVLIRKNAIEKREIQQLFQRLNIERFCTLFCVFLSS